MCRGDEGGSVPFAELDLTTGFQVVELPANERVVEGVDVRGDERSTPVNLERIVGGFSWVFVRLTFKPIISRSRLTCGGK